MTVERLSDYLQSGSGSSIRRIFIAHQIQREIKNRFGEEVVVILTANRIKIKCHSPAQKVFLGSKKLSLTSLVREITNSEFKLLISA